MSTVANLEAAHRNQVAPRVYAYDLEALPWRETPRGTAREKAVRRDNERGLFLGLITFDPMSRSGLHQHLGTASSYFLAGSLTDHQATTREGHVGINLRGATHDAVTYGGATLVSRLEGPVVIPDGGLAIHPHADQGPVRNHHPETPPDITIELERTLAIGTRFAGVVRRPLFDYAGTGDVRRMCCLTLWPGGGARAVRHSALTDLFVLSGDLRVDGVVVHGPSFVIVEPDTAVTISTQYGCSLLAWAEGPAVSEEDPGAELYGFN
ncbi:MAG TPA: hypothetical protein VHA82_02390 [Ramlibacter sp.]|uniref:cupin domain-containing protein n=1 Tax=Ramlibacter sp. TaxID=1917967 RepID=UPI002D02BB8E|nr:hypothetical protein [Ramlibacter sp.]HVZ42631.1 hypothetical protein [Ramlibacter sp.]